MTLCESCATMAAVRVLPLPPPTARQLTPMTFHRSLPALRTAVLTALLAGGILVGPVAGPSTAAARPIKPHVSPVRLGGINATAWEGGAKPAGAGQHGRVLAVTGERSTAPFRLVGLTWTGPTDAVTGWVRTHHNGRWSSWQPLPDTASDDAAGPGSVDRSTSEGTDPLVVEPSDGVQTWVEGQGQSPSNLQLSLVDPGTSPADDIASAPLAQAAQAAAGMPTVYSRASWGADESIRRAAPSYGTVDAAIIHHTAGSNTYGAADAPALIRGIYAYHVLSLGWNDIGYNALVDKYGRIWEGRYGGLDRSVIGAHAAGYNAVTFGVSGLGTYTSTAPTRAMLDAYTRIVAWKLGINHVDPLSTVSLSDGTTTQSVNAVLGHREVNSTGCPGNALYAKLPAIRTAVKALQGTSIYAPSTSSSSLAYGGGAVTLGARPSTAVSWRLTVSNVCLGQVWARNGTATTAGIWTVWDGERSDGSWAPTGTYTLTLTAWSGSTALLTAPPWSGTVDVAPTSPTDPAACLDRLSGSDRYATSVAVARAADRSAAAVVLVSGASGSMADALVAAPLALSQQAALMLTTKSALPATVATEISRRQVTRAVIVGGTGVISSQVEQALKNLGVTTMDRLAGQDRYATAALVSAAIAPRASEVLVASGEDASLVDGLGISGPAASLGEPILLVNRSGIPQVTAAALSSLSVTSSIVVGGAGVVPDSVLAQLPSPTRVSGANRYDTSAAVAAWAATRMASVHVLIASGEQGHLADVLSGGQLREISLYVNSDGVPFAVQTWLTTDPAVQGSRVVGGVAAVPDAVAGVVAELLRA